VKLTLLLPFLLILLLPQVGKSDVASPDELEVYRVLFKGRGTLVLARPGSKTKQDGHDAKEQDKYNVWLRKMLPEADETTIADYARCYNAPALLNAKSDVGVRLVFVEKKILDDFWTHIAFGNSTLDDYRKHPEKAPSAKFRERFSGGDFVKVSRVGFNTGRTQALVFWYLSSNEESFTILLEKQEGKWIIKNSALESAG